MCQIPYKTPSAFSGRKVSVNQTIRLFRRDDIRINGAKAAIILYSLYLIVKTYKIQQNRNEFEPKG